MRRGKVSQITVFILTVAMVFSSLTFAFADGISVTSESTKNSITLKWSAVKGANRYKVNDEDLGTKKEYTKTGLSPNTAYTFVVDAYRDKEKLVSSSITVITKGVGNIAKVSAIPGYKSVTVRFKKVKNASYYQLQKKNKKGKWEYVKAASGKPKKLTSKKYTDKKYNTAFIIYRDTKGIKPNKNAKYRVRAVRNQDNKLYYGKWSKQVSAKAVRQMYQNIKVGGKWRVANGYSGGKFYTMDGGVYNVTRVSSATADYSKKKNYTNRAAENFVNEMMKSGKFRRNGKKRMIWISSYTQHVYVLKWTKKGWRVEKDWECSTGKADSPTPMGFNKKIDHRHYSHGSYGIHYWNCFSTHNAIHGKTSSMALGVPGSHGCVRNNTEDAHWVYSKVALKTPVVSW